MKNTRKCPKCGGSNIISVPGLAGAYGDGNNIIKDPKIKSIKSAVLIDRYICTTCGFSEKWTDLDYMDKLKREYDEI